MAFPSFTFLVNSCDRFEDTWLPFFELYRLNCQGLDTNEIVLVTDRKEYRHEGLAIRSTGVGRANSEPLSWSAQLIDALDGLTSDLVLYVQDDYFIDKPIDAEFVNRMAHKMAGDPSIDRIELTSEGSRGPFEKTDDPDLVSLSPKAHYRITTQASLWRVETLRSYLRPEENGWMFEIYGTRRSWRRENRFLIYSPERPEPITYTKTGIIRGKWHKAMPALFDRYGLSVDFDRRGFYREPTTFQRRWATLRTLMTSPRSFVQGLRGL